MISPDSELIGETPSSVNFKKKFNAVIVSVISQGEDYKEKLKNREIKSGDCFLLRTTTSFVNKYGCDSQFSLVSKVDGIEIPLKDKIKMILSLLIVGCMIAATSTGYVSLLGKKKKIFFFFFGLVFFFS